MFPTQWDNFFRKRRPYYVQRILSLGKKDSVAVQELINEFEEAGGDSKSISTSFPCQKDM